MYQVLCFHCATFVQCANSINVSSTNYFIGIGCVVRFRYPQTKALMLLVVFMLLVWILYVSFASFLTPRHLLIEDTLAFREESVFISQACTTLPVLPLCCCCCCYNASAAAAYTPVRSLVTMFWRFCFFHWTAILPPHWSVSFAFPAWKVTTWYISREVSCSANGRMANY